MSVVGEMLNRIKACKYECEAGPLENNVDFKKLESVAESMENETVIDEKEIQDYIFNEMTKQGYAVSHEAIKIIMELEIQYLVKQGVATEVDE